MPDGRRTGDTDPFSQSPRPGRFRSPWLSQLSPASAFRPLEQDMSSDLVIVGAGIAGLATAYFCLRETASTVTLLERSRAGHGASGRNAGQLVTYFERPLADLVDSFGLDMATRGQAEIEAAWGLLDEILAETGIDVPLERFDGAMGMYTLNHLEVHLRNQSIRAVSGLMQERVDISDRAPFLDQIPADFRPFYRVVPHSEIQDALGVHGDDFWAVLVNRKGCGNSALLCERVLDVLLHRHEGRFRYFDGTSVDRIVLHTDHAEVLCPGGSVRAGRVVLCTNGFAHHVVENRAGPPIGPQAGGLEQSIVGYMSAFTDAPGIPASATSFILNDRIGGDLPYYYTTRRPYRLAGQDMTLTCLGGPERRIGDTDAYDAEGEMPAEIMAEFDTRERPVVAPDRPEGIPFDFQWHGLMGYTRGKLRQVGVEPKNPVLLYNLGCNGVGFLPSIAGGRRIARLLCGEALAPSLFDPV